MTLEEIAEVRPRLVDFTAEMLGGLPRKDQRASGELYVRGLLTGGQRKSMQPMAARVGGGPQRVQQVIPSPAWGYVAGGGDTPRGVGAGAAGGGVGGARARV